MYQIGMDDFGYVVHVDVHVDELLEVKVDFAVGEGEHSVADVRLNARLFRVEEVHDRVGHVKHFRFEPAQQPRLFRTAAAAAAAAAAVVVVASVVAVVVATGHRHVRLPAVFVFTIQKRRG